MNKADREPLVGLEYVLEYRGPTKLGRIGTRYKCELCRSDRELEPMLAHLCGFKHRKAFLAKEYPFVLKAPSSKNEDRAQFFRRMALEIEQEDGLKMYKIDPSTKLESLLTLEIPPPKPPKVRNKKTRWENLEIRVKKALEYLENFEIETDAETTTVTDLTQKLTEGLKAYNFRKRQETLFPARVAKAKDVAMSIMQNELKRRDTNSKPAQPNNVPLDMTPENIMLKQNMIMQGLIPPPVLPPHLIPPPMVPPPMVPPPMVPPPMMPPPMMPLPIPPNVGPQAPAVLPHFGVSVQGANGALTNQTPHSVTAPQSNLNTDDDQFFQRLIKLLSALPQNTQGADDMLMSSKLMMLKSMLLDKTHGTDNVQLNQQMMTQIASLTNGADLMKLMAASQNFPITSNTPLNQHLMMLMASQNSRMDNVLYNQRLMMQIAENAENMENIPLSELMLMGQNTENIYPGVFDPNMHAEQDYVDTSQFYGDAGYDLINNQASYNAQYNSDAADLLTYSADGTPQIQYGDVQCESDLYLGNSAWDSSCVDPVMTQVVDPSYPYDEYAEEPPIASYTRVTLSPKFTDTPLSTENKDISGKRFSMGRPNVFSDERRQGHGPQKMRSDSKVHRTRSRFSEKYSADGERAGGHSSLSHRSFERSTEEEELLDEKTAGLSADILKRIRGKDLFTVSAILSEYAESRKSK
ncbi:uncharacterized protein WCC33_010512 [Rhinophrynus dorsalis]